MTNPNEPEPFITPEDLRSSLGSKSESEIQELIDDAVALARLDAPCIDHPSFPHRASLKAILRAAIKYTAGAGDGSVTQVSGGPWQKTVDTRQKTNGVFFNEAQTAKLKSLCRPQIRESGSYSVRLGFPEGI